VVTLTVATIEEEHPNAVPVTVYVAVEPGVTIAVFVPVATAPALHVYEAAPIAVKVAVLPEQMLKEFTVTCGEGLTIILYKIGAEHVPELLTETVIVLVIGEPAVFVGVNAEVFPVPLAAKPIAVFEFVHAYVPPTGVVE